MNNENNTVVTPQDKVLENEKGINDDILRYRNNSLGFYLCILAIICNVAMFIIIFGEKNCKPDLALGIDVIVNIVFLLFAFLLAEKCKAYETSGYIGSLVLGVIEIARIFWIPLKYYLCNIEYHKLYSQHIAQGGTAKDFSYDGIIGLESGQFTATIVLMVLAALFLFGACIITYMRRRRLDEHLKVLGVKR